jgi:hypothetical protein
MHCSIGKDNKDGAEYTQTDGVNPQMVVVETKRAEDCRTRDLDVEAVFVVDETQSPDFVDDETFESVVEN